MPAVPSTAAEAARYALLRRLAPSFRHHLVVNLQPIGMICEVMDRRLRAPTPDIAHVQDSAGKINGFARAALNSCMDVVGWLAPDEAATAAVEPSVRECAALLATSFSFRGYALRNQVGDLPGAVRRSAIRSLLPALLMHCADHLPAPAELLLAAAGDSAGARITLDVRPAEGEQAFRGEPNYRNLEWADLQALAAPEGAEVTREAQRFTLVLPWVVSA